ncbi:hypothetical protein BH23ACT9_BH23ACT9_38690 [soil metagenome]
MELEHTFTVPVPPTQAFKVLQDIERIGPCMPGASIDSVDGTAFTGKVKVKIGPIQVTYAGAAEYVAVDADALTATIDARGKEARGSGTANATVKAAIREVPAGAEVHVVTDLAITGKPAQFGRGVMEEVGQKLINQFADCLASKLGESDESDEPDPADPADPPAAGDGAAVGTGAAASNGSAGAPAQVAQSTTAATQPRPSEPEAIDLLDVAGGSVAKRLGPLVGGVVVLVLLIRWLRRR